MLENKTVAILGAGRSGRAAALLALAKGAKVTIYDTSEQAADPKISGVAFRNGVDESFGDKVICDLLVLSPGIDTYGPLAKAFAKHANEVVGEVELAARYYKGRIIGITGTNGKTTTTEIVERLVNAAGESCLACGNYGLPVAEIVLRDDQPDVLALELSSFQLETTSQLQLDAMIWLNFAPDHMDRYPTVEAYRVAKERILINAKSSDTVIVRAGEQLPKHHAQIVSFASEAGVNADWIADGTAIKQHGKEILNLKSTRLRGAHNGENVCAALAAVQALGLSIANAQVTLESYQPPAHRCELVATINGIEYLNDSKATNLHALESALRALPGTLVLICGGKEKGLDYAPLANLLGGKVRAMICIGEIGDKLARQFANHTQTEKAGDLEQAVRRAQELAQVGDTVLFSPGTSSFDMFSGYEERGETYRKLANLLRNP